MRLSGKVIKLLPIITGQGENGDWKRQEVIVETRDRFPKKVCVSIWGSLIGSASLQIGQSVEMFLDIESREYNEKWYTNTKAYRIDIVADSSGGNKIENGESFESDNDIDAVLPF